MEFEGLDPFGDFSSAGYLRNRFGKKDLEVVGRLETFAYTREVLGVLRWLRKRTAIAYEDVLEVHSLLFRSVYPWAGQDRSMNAPDIAICKGGYNNLFAHPADVARATNFALALGQDRIQLRRRPGEVFGYLAHAHPFLEGNGRTILTVYAELTRRAGFYISWDRIDRDEFLQTLTVELLQPGKGAMDALVFRNMHDGALSADVTARRLRANFARAENRKR